MLCKLNNTSSLDNSKGPTGAGAGASPRADGGGAPEPWSVGIRTAPAWVSFSVEVLKPRVTLNLAPWALG